MKDEVKVIALLPFEYKGNEVKEGDEITVSKAQAEAMKSRKLIK